MDLQPLPPIAFPPEDKFGILVDPPSEGWHAKDFPPQPVLDELNSPTPRLATVVGEDVDIYNAKNEPDGAGQVVGMLRVGTQVQPIGGCAPESWCQVTLPDGTSTGWVWGHLQLP